MRFEKLTENKIRITFNLDDLKEKNIDLHSFMANSEETQDLFFDMLQEAEKEIGFVTKDYKIMIEALATYDGHFVITVTRSLPDIKKPTQKKLRAKRKNIMMNTHCSCTIYEFSDFDDFCNLCNCFNEDFIKRINKNCTHSTLYLYQSNYYLIIKRNENKDDNFDKNFNSSLSEFGTLVKNSELFENKLLEYGSIIIKDKAFSKIKKYFVS